MVYFFLDFIKHHLGTTDPFVAVKLNGDEYKRTIKKKDLNPVWNETILIPIENFDKKNINDYKLHIEVWDKDFFGKDAIGELFFDLSTLISCKDTEFSKELLK